MRVCVYRIVQHAVDLTNRGLKKVLTWPHGVETPVRYYTSSYRPFLVLLAPEAGGTWSSSPLCIEREHGSEQLGDFAAEQVPLGAVLSLSVFVLVVHADSLEQRLAHPCFSHKHTTCVICT